MGRPGKLTPEQVVEIRESYEHQRDLADNDPDPDYRETVVQTEDRLSERYDVSSSMIRRIVLGLSYATAGGPIDERRRAVAKEVLDANPPTAVRITTNRPGMSPQTFTYPPGTTVLVEPIVDDPNNYTTTGKLKTAESGGTRAPAKTAAPKAKAKSRPAASPPMKPRRKPRDDYDASHDEEYQADSSAPSSGLAAQMLRGE